MIKAVLFDVDGTLVDSNRLHAEAWVKAFAKYGVHVSTDEVQSQIGKGGDQLLPVFLTDEQQKQFGEEMSKYRGKLFQDEYMSQVRPFADTRELFERIIADGKRPALATSAKEQQLAQLKKIAHIDDLVAEESKSDDVERSKPFPDIFAATLDKLGLSPDQAVAVGDTPWDVKACGKLNLPCLAVTCGGWSAEDLKAAGAAAVYRDPADLLQKYDESLLAK